MGGYIREDEESNDYGELFYEFYNLEKENI